MSDLRPNLLPKSLEGQAAWLLLLLASLFIIWAAHPVWEEQHLNDDSFITLTYAKNLINGNGFVYNQPPATLGTTTPLFTLLSALLAVIIPGLGVIKSAIILSIASCIGTGLMLYLAARRLGWRPLAGALVALVPITIVDKFWLPFIGMETWLFQFLLVLSFYLSLGNHQRLAGVAVALLFLTRGEGILVAAVVGSYFLLVNRRIPVQFILAGLVVFGLWAAYALLTFGTVLPNTLSAKTAHQAFFMEHGVDFGFFQAMRAMIPRWVRSFGMGPALALNAFLAAMLVGIYAVALRKQYHWAFFLAWGGVYFLAYTIINPATYPWYALHLFFVLELLAGVGAGWLLQSAAAAEGRGRIVSLLAGAALAVLLVGPNIYRGVNSVQTYSGDSRAATYKAVAEWLRQHTEPGESIAYLEIGYLGYYSQNRIIDLAGLIDPLIAANIAENGFTWGFWHYQPDYFLYHPGFDSELRLAGLRSAVSQYEEVARFTKAKGNETLILFRRIE